MGGQPRVDPCARQPKCWLTDMDGRARPAKNHALPGAAGIPCSAWAEAGGGRSLVLTNNSIFTPA